MNSNLLLYLLDYVNDLEKYENEFKQQDKKDKDSESATRKDFFDRFESGSTIVPVTWQIGIQLIKGNLTICEDASLYSRFFGVEEKQLISYWTDLSLHSDDWKILEEKMKEDSFIDNLCLAYNQRFYYKPRAIVYSHFIKECLDIEFIDELNNQYTQNINKYSALSYSEYFRRRGYLLFSELS